LEESRLRVALDVLQMKAKHRWTDTSVDDILEYLKDLLPAENTCPDILAKAKRITCPLDLPHEKCHACINDCIIIVTSTWTRPNVRCVMLIDTRKGA
jgi:hypothetical protein